jgi:hypothetical protein
MLNADHLDPALVRATLGVVVKHAADEALVGTNLDRLLERQPRP